MAGKVGSLLDEFSPQMATPNGFPIKASQIDDIASESRMFSKSLDDAPTSGSLQGSKDKQVRNLVENESEDVIEHLGNKRVRFKEMEVRAVRKLDYLTEKELRFMMKEGVSSRTIGGKG